MAYYDGDRLILNNEEMVSFQHSIAAPTPGSIRARDLLFSELDCMDIRENEDGSFELGFEPVLVDSIVQPVPSQGEYVCGISNTALLAA